MLPALGAISVALVPHDTWLAVSPPRMKTKWSTRATAKLVKSVEATMVPQNISANRFIVTVLQWVVVVVAVVPVVAAAMRPYSAASAALPTDCSSDKAQ